MLPLDRFQGNVKLVGNAELRWRAITIGELELGAVVGVDAGRVSAPPRAERRGPVPGRRGGRPAGVAWSHQLVIRADVGIAPTNTFFLDFGEVF